MKRVKSDFDKVAVTSIRLSPHELQRAKLITQTLGIKFTEYVNKAILQKNDDYSSILNSVSVARSRHA